MLKNIILSGIYIRRMVLILGAPFLMVTIFTPLILGVLMPEPETSGAYMQMTKIIIALAGLLMAVLCFSSLVWFTKISLFERSMVAAIQRSWLMIFFFTSLANTLFIFWYPRIFLAGDFLNFYIMSLTIFVAITAFFALSVFALEEFIRSRRNTGD